MVGGRDQLADHRGAWNLSRDEESAGGLGVSEQQQLVLGYRAGEM